MARFDPERMAVYRLARAHTRAVRTLIAGWKPAKRAHYLGIARGSTLECWAHTDSLVDFGLAPREAIREVRDLQGQITALLITSILNLEAQQEAASRRAAPGAGARRPPGPG